MGGEPNREKCLFHLVMQRPCDTPPLICPQPFILHGVKPSADELLVFDNPALLLIEMAIFQSKAGLGPQRLADDHFFATIRLARRDSENSERRKRAAARTQRHDH